MLLCGNHWESMGLQQLSAGHPSGWLSQPLIDRGQHTYCQARLDTLGDQAAVCVDRHMWYRCVGRWRRFGCASRGVRVALMSAG